MSTAQLSIEHAAVFVDETGHDRFHDPLHPVFGWAGCAMSVPTYTRVSEAWRAMKREQFPGVDVLHAADLRPTHSQLTALDQFFRTQPFSRFGAVTRADASIEISVLSTMAAATMKRIETVLAYIPFRRLALLFEAGDAWNAKANSMFGPTTLYDDGVEIPVDRFFMSKDAAEPGLEIADFVTHAVGGVGRTQNLNRKDFASVFRSRPREQASFVLVQSARPAEHPPIAKP
jgi:hypothetical protein